MWSACRVVNPRLSYFLSQFENGDAPLNMKVQDNNFCVVKAQIPPKARMGLLVVRYRQIGQRTSDWRRVKFLSSKVPSAVVAISSQVKV